MSLLITVNKKHMCNVAFFHVISKIIIYEVLVSIKVSKLVCLSLLASSKAVLYFSTACMKLGPMS